jgi:hypothetical protein
MAEILGLAAAVIGLLTAVLGIIWFFMSRGRQGESGETTTQTVSGTGNEVVGGDSNVVSDDAFSVRDSENVNISVVNQYPPPPQPNSYEQTETMDGNRWEGRLPSLENYFVGRQAELDRVAKAIKESSLVVISGGAGTGKSRLAAEFTYLAEYGGFWTSAGGTADQSLAALAPRLGIDTTGANDKDIALTVGRAIADLPQGFVWVVDNLIEIGQARELQSSAPNLTLLITTRDSRGNLLPPPAEFLPLTLLEPQAAVELLRTQGAEDSDGAVLIEIADSVGYLPLALEMLAVRLGEPLADAGSVLSELKQAHNPLAVRSFEDAAGQAVGGSEGVYSAISGTLNSLTPATRKAISPFGYLADEPIPQSLALTVTGLDTNGLSRLLGERANQSVLSVSEDRLLVHALTAAAITATNDPNALA